MMGSSNIIGVAGDFHNYFNKLPEVLEVLEFIPQFLKKNLIY